MTGKVALIAGGTGLVGRLLLDMLLDDPFYEKIIAVGRRPVQGSAAKLINLVVDFREIANKIEGIKADDVFCCLGTTMKKAGSKEKFREVDYQYPLQLAQLCKENDAQQFLLVSALGADKKSSIFYNRVKGEVEEAIEKVDYQSYHIFRPALLKGPRVESRPGEETAKKFFDTLGFLFIGPLKKYKALEAEKLARAMLKLAKQQTPGHFIHESGELQNY